MFREKIKPDSYFSRSIEMKRSPTHGLGVFATCDIPVHFCIEISPVILFSSGIINDYWDLHETDHVIADYVFTWNPTYRNDSSYDMSTASSTINSVSGGSRHSTIALALGSGMIYNHSSNPNVQWRKRKTDFPAIEYWTMRETKAGDELFIRYQPANRSHTLDFIDEAYGERLGIEPDSVENFKVESIED